MSHKIVKIMAVALFVALVSFYSCSEKNDAGSGILDDNGLSRDINEIVPDTLLEKIKDLGMPVNTGDNPPNIEGAFLISPLTMIATSRENDNYEIGQVISDYYLKFSEQNNNDLTVNIDYYNGGEVGSGIGSYIVGDSKKFSVFARLFVTYLTDSAYTLVLFSGSKEADGLHDMHYALFMIDNFDSQFLINNGEGRIFNDGDGLSAPTDYFFPKATLFKDFDPDIPSALKK